MRFPVSRHYRRTVIAILAWFAASRVCTCPAAPILEGYPENVRERLKVREQHIATLSAAERNNLTPFSVISTTSKWRVGQTIRVAFNGGESRLHKEIADTAVKWVGPNLANLKLDFGLDPATGTYRLWTTNARYYQADVRVSFKYAGYWSHVGRDSIRPSICSPGDPSLNLEGFHIEKPLDWEAVVLHEFGHALGFQHEHQSPAGGCDAEFRWEDDPGYTATTNLAGELIVDGTGRRPGVYSILGGEPNNWNRARVDFNLRQFPNSSAYIIGAFDRTSIMMYSFYDWMFVNGVRSACYTPPNVDISPQDAAGAASVYPRAPAAIVRANGERTALAKRVAESPLLPKSVSDEFETTVRELSR